MYKDMSNDELYELAKNIDDALIRELAKRMSDASLHGAEMQDRVRHLECEIDSKDEMLSAMALMEVSDD